MAEGIVFSVLRGSMYDGPGIRTTVFLKGCNLNCLWCHNPEGSTFAPQLAYRAHQCIGCGACAAVCHNKVHHFHCGTHQVNFSACQACGKCVEHCPTGALQIYGKKMTVQEVMSVVLSDKHYYRGGGGLTLSGGEPLLQADFALALLQSAKENNINTCVETAGCISLQVLQQVAQDTDLFLFDYKATGAENHFQLTGVENKQILNNLEWLYTRPSKIRLRCPIIPGCNDTAEHFAGIAAMAKKYPALDGIEIMPYHDFGVSKSSALGLQSQFAAPAATALQKQQWIQSLHALGVAGVVANDG